MHPSPRLLLDSLKRCPLCEAVNAQASETCFVCGWAGEFERDAEDLQASFDDLVAKCPDLAGLKPSKKGWISRLKKSLPFLRTRSA